MSSPRAPDAPGKRQTHSNVAFAPVTPVTRHESLHKTSMYDSETESEPECDLKKWDATEFASQLPRAMSENPDRDSKERVTDAIATLASIPVEEVLVVSFGSLF